MELFQDKYQADYEVYKIMLNGQVDINQNLKICHQNMKNKYGNTLANNLWDKFIERYAKE